MSTITFSQWGFGLDLRKGASTSDANRLRVLKNAYITDGKTIRKRFGCTKLTTLDTGTEGLFAGLGKLNTFQIVTPTYPAVTHSNPLFKNNLLQDTLGVYDETETKKLAGILACEPFNGFLYVVAQHWDHITIPASIYLKSPQHHYVDGSPTFVAAAPQVAGITKTSSKIYAANGDVVSYSATNAPRDWATANNAGFLPVGLQQSGSKDSTALGTYNNKLVVFFSDSAQIWQVDPDPLQNQFLQTVDIGTVLPYAHQNMAGDVFFLSPAGVRTITKQAQTENLVDADVGSPIDEQLLNGAFIDLKTARAQYFRAVGQYWLYTGNTALVFTFSRSAKVSAWSVYEFPFTLDYIDELNTVLYIRSGDDIYQMDRAVHTDNGTVYEVQAETPFVDFKTPGVDKMIYAVDAVFSGSGELSHRFDQRNPSLVTAPPITITGDTQPGNTYPVELVSTNMATVIRNFDDQEFEVHSLSYKFENLR